MTALDGGTPRSNTRHMPWKCYWSHCPFAFPSYIHVWYWYTSWTKSYCLFSTVRCRVVLPDRIVWQRKSLLFKPCMSLFTRCGKSDSGTPIWFNGITYTFTDCNVFTITIQIVSKDISWDTQQTTELIFAKIVEPYMEFLS